MAAGADNVVSTGASEPCRSAGGPDRTGAALTMILSQYNYVMMGTVWADIALETGVRTDVSRFGALEVIKQIKAIPGTVTVEEL